MNKRWIVGAIALFSVLVLLAPFFSVSAQATQDCATLSATSGIDPTELSRLSGGTSPPSEWSCRIPSNSDERSFSCLPKPSGTNVCPGMPSSNYCCLPAGIASGFGCADASTPGAAALITNSATDPATWYCQRFATTGEGRADRDAFCVSSSICGTRFSCCIPTTAQAATRAHRTGAAAPAVNCAAQAVAAGGITNEELAIKTAGLGTTSAVFTCVRACQASPIRNARCVPLGCTQTQNGGDDNSGVLCCAPNSGFPAVTAQNACTAGVGTTAATGLGAGGTSGGSAGNIRSIALPSCIRDGKCTLDDILRTGASFANFLLELSGALFLLIFVYAGFKYLLAMGNDSTVKSAKDMLRNAAIGMILIIGASTMVRYIYATLTAPADAPYSACYTQFGEQGFDCRYIPGDNTAEITANVSALGCKPTIGLCNLQGQDVNFRCCPLVGGSTTP